MSYESKVYFAQDCRGYLNILCPIAYVDCSRMPMGFEHVFTHDVNGSVYVDSAEPQECDCYGVPMRYATLHELVEWVDAQDDSDLTSYRRFKLLRDTAHAFDPADYSYPIIAIHYGY